jgi:hypothetical protein
MSPFTHFFGRLVSLVGAESATGLVREFAGKTLQFPVTDHYGFPATAKPLGAAHALHLEVDTAQPSPFAPLRLSDLATQPRAARLQELARELSHSSQALQLHAALLEQARLAVLAEIECQQRDSTGA